MKTLSDFLTEYTDTTKDNTLENIARGTRRMNDLQKEICAARDYWWAEKLYTVLTVAGQQIYDLPRLSRKIVSVTVSLSNSSITYGIDEVANEKFFDKININTASLRSDWATYFTIRGNQIYLYPTPATSGNTLGMLYLKRPLDMSVTDYSTGTIAVTAGSLLVTGTGTSWLTTAKTHVGTYIFINGSNGANVPYEIASVQSDTSLTLVQQYQDVTSSGLTYRMGDSSLIFEDFQNILWYRAVSDYYLKKENESLRREYYSMYQELKDIMYQSSGEASTQIYSSPNNIYPGNINNYPQNLVGF